MVIDENCWNASQVRQREEWKDPVRDAYQRVEPLIDNEGGRAVMILLDLELGKTCDTSVKLGPYCDTTVSSWSVMVGESTT